MDPEPGLHHRNAIPRFSRLPMPRASQDNLKLTRSSTTPTVHQTSLARPPQLPQPSKSYSSRIVPPTALSETINNSFKPRYGWNDSSSRSRNRSPVRDALQSAPTSSIEKTPPTSFGDIPVFEDGNENPTSNANAIDKSGISDSTFTSRDRRKPRLSLAERTVETLSQIPPSPSPANRRSSVASSDGPMGPPGRPASSMRNRRPVTPSTSRPASPTKQPFRPPGRISPTDEKGAAPVVPSPGSLYTPPRAFMRDRRSSTTQTSRGSRVFSSAGLVDGIQTKPDVASSKRGSQPISVKSSGIRKSELTQPSNGRQSLASLFKDPLAPPKGSDKYSLSRRDHNAGVSRPRSRVEVSAASRSQPKSTKSTQKTSSITKEEISIDNLPEKPIRDSPKSSSSLRETIAKAKSVHKGKLPNTKDGQKSNSISDQTLDVDLLSAKPSTGVIRKRLQDALVSGYLNIAAMNLTQIPTEVLKMYESEDTATNWSEMVDLVKFNAADNQIEQIDDVAFPDWSASELEEDDEKTNQFGGLESIDLHNNLLTQIPIGIRRLERLSILHLNGNKLNRDVMQILGQVSGLKELHLAKNDLGGIIELEDAAFDELQILDLRGNHITAVSGFHRLKCLQKLNVSENALSKLPWHHLAKCPLSEIDVSKNQFTGMLLEGVTTGFENLRSLNGSANGLETISDDGLTLPSLQSLAVDSNKLTAIPDLDLWPSILTISASENQLTNIPASFSESKLLKAADFSHNSIKLIDSRISRMESLVSLNLAGNPLRDRKYLTMNFEDMRLDLEKRLGSADDLPSTGDVSSSNKASSGSSNLLNNDVDGTQSGKFLFTPTNGVLDLSSRNLSAVSLEEIDLSSGSSVTTLRLSNNDLTALPFELLSHPSLKYSLRSLDLSHNPQLHPMSYLEQEVFLPSLQSLYIVSTGLTSLDALTTYLKAPDLREINISCHRLTGHVPWVRVYFPNCTTLLATDNWFSSVDVEGVRGLEVLDVRNNEIEALPPKLGLLGNHAGKVESRRLRVLEVSGNPFRVPRISIVEKGAEAVLKDLRRMVPSNEVGAEWEDEV